MSRPTPDPLRAPSTHSLLNVVYLIDFPSPKTKDKYQSYQIADFKALSFRLTSIFEAGDLPPRTLPMFMLDQIALDSVERGRPNRG